jgi:hypothetical protein
MLVAIVDKAIEYHFKFLLLKKYSSAELLLLTLPFRATKKINMK